MIDKKGAWVSKNDYQQMRLAAGYRAGIREPAFGWHFKKTDRWGLLDLDGRVLLDADFDQAITRCADGRLEGHKNKELLSFKADGTPLQPSDGKLVGALCNSVPPYALKTGEKFTLVDANSIPLIQLQFDAVSQFPGGVKNVKIDGKWGRIGPDGRWLLEPRFDYLSGHADTFVASVDGKRGFMRSDGTWVIEPKFDAAARRQNSDTAFVTVAGATGVVRLADQSWVVPPRPGVMCDINHALMTQGEGKRTILSKAGQDWIEIDAERIGISLDIGLLTFLRDGKWGLVDTTGRVTVEPQYEEPVAFLPRLRGIAWAKRDGKWCAIDRRGHPVEGISCAPGDPLGGPGGRFECKVEP
ncbi:WG repeat-containing protein [Bradyrhizobium sp. JYMT SZCCT0428]|uniref:WG repeat-containing protein n=1 Tax=Bradyrhizobium sp. JYMT SZCCT0428 TaxID=2807673 RepID=UPI001BADEEEF|nr:WG repeat-containing protein [Bradyrhizobium sp. JYMT SZCCT0428]MBR1152238.1 WG repeat-containing protein [Bradyrhizobium sp. JYMT SZCCT0428]